MRKSRQETAETRARIVSVAATEFAEKGIAATGLSDIMGAAGLTHGGFYKHFESKEQLVGEAFEEALEQTLATMQEKSLDTIAAQYLAKDHRDTFVVACPYASMGSELQHAETSVREAASNGVTRFLNAIAASMTDLPPRERKARAQAIVSSMVGALLLSRVVEDPKLSDDILKNTRKFISQS